MQGPRCSSTLNYSLPGAPARSEIPLDLREKYFLQRLLMVILQCNCKKGFLRRLQHFGSSGRSRAAFSSRPQAQAGRLRPGRYLHLPASKSEARKKTVASLRGSTQSICMYTRILIFIHTYVYVYIYVCVCVYIWYAYIYLYTCIYVYILHTGVFAQEALQAATSSSETFASMSLPQQW